MTEHLRKHLDTINLAVLQVCAVISANASTEVADTPHTMHTTCELHTDSHIRTHLHAPKHQLHTATHSGNISNLQVCQQEVEQNNGPFRAITTYEEEKEELNLRRLKYCTCPHALSALLFSDHFYLLSYPTCAVACVQLPVHHWKKLYPTPLLPAHGET